MCDKLIVLLLLTFSHRHTTGGEDDLQSVAKKG